MDVRIVIKTDKKIIIDAKKLAASKKISLSKMVESYWRDLVDGKENLLIYKK